MRLSELKIIVSRVDRAINSFHDEFEFTKKKLIKPQVCLSHYPVLTLSFLPRMTPFLIFLP